VKKLSLVTAFVNREMNKHFCVLNHCLEAANQ